MVSRGRASLHPKTFSRPSYLQHLTSGAGGAIMGETCGDGAQGLPTILDTLVRMGKIRKA